MLRTNDHQDLVNFFTNYPLPTGPQHINKYSVFLNLSGAVATGLEQLRSEVEASNKSAVIMLNEIKEWLITREVEVVR